MQKELSKIAVYDSRTTESQFFRICRGVITIIFKRDIGVFNL